MKPTARLIIADSESSADLFWATRFVVPDPILYLEIGGKKILIASDLEFSRAQKEAAVDQVLRKGPLPDVETLDRFLKKRKIRRIEVPASFPFRYAEALQKKKYRVRAVPDPFFPKREFKNPAEKREIVKSLRATEDAILFAIDTIRQTRIRRGRLYLKGTPLTSESLRRMMEIRMMGNGCLARHTIVSCGREAADPHCIGSGPLLANQPIVLDVFPKSISSGYYGDITRTVIKGKASPKLCEMYAAVRKAQEAGISKVRSGVDAARVHQAVVSTLEGAGFRTGNRNGRPEGFIHGTGHGLGLEIHEPPRIGKTSNILKKGHVVTVEPGLYYRDLGGIRIEDVVFVTNRGCEVLTRIPKKFEIEGRPYSC